MKDLQILTEGQYGNLEWFDVVGINYHSKTVVFQGWLNREHAIGFERVTDVRIKDKEANAWKLK